MDTKRLALPAVALIALGAGACTPASPASSAPASVTTQTTTQTATQTTTATAAPPSGADSSGAGGHGTSSSTTFPSGTASGSSAPAPVMCTGPNLEVTHAADPDGTGAGKIGVTLTVKNIGSATCQLGEPDGKSSIVFVTGPQSVQQIGSAAYYEPLPADRVLILPGTQVSTKLQITRAENIPDCQPQKAWALAVFPLKDQYAVTPVDNMTACANGDHMIIAAQPWKAA